MKKEDIIQATALKIQSGILEVFQALKDEYSKPADAGTTDRLAKQITMLSSLENALTTLQQYSPRIMEVCQQEALESSLAAARMALAEQREIEKGESHEIVAENSDTMKRVQEVHDQQDEPEGSEEGNEE